MDENKEVESAEVVEEQPKQEIPQMSKEQILKMLQVQSNPNLIKFQVDKEYPNLNRHERRKLVKEMKQKWKADINRIKKKLA